jgi:hypothetical protein
MRNGNNLFSSTILQSKSVLIYSTLILFDVIFESFSILTKRSVNFEMSFWCHRFDQNTSKIILRISALASKNRSNKKVPNQIIFKESKVIFFI